MRGRKRDYDEEEKERDNERMAGREVVKQYNIRQPLEHNNTERDKYQEKWFNIGDRSKKLHHTRTYVYKNNSDCFSYTVSSQRRTEKPEKSKQLKAKIF